MSTLQYTVFHMFEVASYAVLIMLASLVGVISVWKHIGHFIERNLRFLVSFSAGVFLVVAYQLGVETVEHSNTFYEGITWVLVGVIVIFLIFKFLPTFHHHHDDKEEAEAHSHTPIDVRRILVGDGIHNIADGILLAASFAVSSALGMITALGIFVHELVQEVSEFFVLKQAGFSTKRALWLNFIVSSTILVGAFGGLFLLQTFESFEIPLLGFAAGSFLIVVLHDLVPHSVRTSQTKTQYFKHILWFLIGILFMVGVNIATAPSHTHEQDFDEHTHAAESHDEDR